MGNPASTLKACAFVLAASSAFVSGCGGAPTTPDEGAIARTVSGASVSTPSVAEAPAETSAASKTLLGEYLGHWDAATQKLTIDPAERDPFGVLVPQSIGALATASIQFDQQGAAVYTNSSSSNPTYGPAGTCSVPTTNTCGTGRNQSCASSVCAAVEIATYQKAHAYDEVVVDVAAVGDAIVNNDDIANGTMPSSIKTQVVALGGYGNAAHRLGDWYYGHLDQGTASSNGADSSVRYWEFDSHDNAASFSFTVRVFGSASYGASLDATPFPSSDPFYDAAGGLATSPPDYNVVTVSGGTQILADDVDDTVATCTSPFSIQLFDQSSTTLWVASSGIVGLDLGTVPTDKTVANPSRITALPTSRYTYAVFPLWSTLVTTSYVSSGGVWCAADTTSSPNKFVVTWAFNEYVVGAGRGEGDWLYYSVVFDEAASGTMSTVHIQIPPPQWEKNAYIFGYSSASGVTYGGTVYDLASIGIQGDAYSYLSYGYAGVVNPSLIPPSPMAQPMPDGTTDTLLNAYGLNLTFSP